MISGPKSYRDFRETGPRPAVGPFSLNLRILGGRLVSKTFVTKARFRRRATAVSNSNGFDRAVARP